MLNVKLMEYKKYQLLKIGEVRRIIIGESQKDIVMEEEDDSERIIGLYNATSVDEKEELKNYFSTDEAFEIVASFTSTMYTEGGISKEQLVYSIEDHFVYEFPVTCITEDSQKKLIEKVKKLNNMQAYIVILMAKEYLSKCEIMDYNFDKLKEIFMISE